MYGLTAENIVINRKALSELAQNEPESFKARARERSACGHTLAHAYPQALVETARRRQAGLDVAQHLRAQHGQQAART